MRFVTFNLWHGLSPSNSPVAFDALEPAGRRALREELQLKLLHELQPDVCFFQEVNPVQQRAPVFADVLKMDAVLQPDLVGLKLFGLGIPFNLNSGLMTMASRSFGLKKIAGVSLSRPGTHFVHNWGSWQLKEERFALFSEAMIPNWGRVLLVATHLHHGLEATPALFEELEKLAVQLELSDSLMAELKRRLNAGSERRAHEVGVLLENLARLEGRYEVVVIGGDFNASPESNFGADLKTLGFRDCWNEAHPEGGGLSYDGTRNQANHRLQGQFPLTVVVEDLSFDSKVKDALLTLLRKQEARPRRIDYLWVRANSLELKIKKTDLIGLPNKEGLAPSDHFGVCADIELS